MHVGAAGARKRARIEIIPLIDIIFFLLATFVMVSLSMTKNQGVKVALPGAAAAQSLSDPAGQDEHGHAERQRAGRGLLQQGEDHPGPAAVAACRR